jgi:hypothetical protein
MSMHGHHICCANCGKEEHKHTNIKHCMVSNGVVFSTECLMEWEKKNPLNQIIEVECIPA